MFYSRGLLSKKGSLGSVWVAAHCFKKLKKEQVKQIDIASSVDTILNGEAATLAYRILAFLLFGVARIYSKKVELLFHDCHDMLDKLQCFMTDKIASKSIIPVHRSYDITLPKRFELDTFDLDISGDHDVSRINVRSHGDITLPDASREEVYRGNDKHYGQEDIPSCGVFSSAYTPASDVCSPWFMDIDSDTRSLNDASSMKLSMVKLVGNGLSFRKRLELEMFGNVEKEPGFDLSPDEGCQTDVDVNCHQPLSMETSIDNESVEPMTRGGAEMESGFEVPLDKAQTEEEQMKCHDLDISCHEPTRMEKSIDDESMEPIVLGDTEKDLGFDMPSDEAHQTDGEQVKHPDAEITCQELATLEGSIDSEPSIEKLREFRSSLADHLQPIILGVVDKECPTAMASDEGHQMTEEQTRHSDARTNLEEVEETRFPYSTSLRNQIQEKSSLSISVNITPDSKISGGSGKGLSEFIVVRTPATKEQVRVPKKRKCIFDEKVVISNRVIKGWIDDASDLVFKRRKAPPTALHAWKVHKMYTLPKSLFEPVIACGADFGSLVSQKKSISKVSVETAETPVDPVPVEPPVTQMSVETAEDPIDPVLVEPPVVQTAAKPAEDPVNPALAKYSAMQISVETADTPVDPVPVETPVTQTSVKPAEDPVNPALDKSSAMQMSVETAGASVNPVLVASPDAEMSYEQNSIAPGTPVTQSSSLRLHEAQGISKPGMSRPASSFDSIDKQPTLNKDQELDIGLMDEEMNSSAGYNPEKCEWSARTRRVATYLHQHISKLSDQDGNGVVNLSRVLKRKTRTESARLFYEILALRTGDYIDVRQADAYGDILVGEKSKLKQTIEAANGNRSRV